MFSTTGRARVTYYVTTIGAKIDILDAVAAIPPGWRLTVLVPPDPAIQYPLASTIVDYQIEPCPGLWARFLRWRYPHDKP